MIKITNYLILNPLCLMGNIITKINIYQIVNLNNLSNFSNNLCDFYKNHRF